MEKLETKMQPAKKSTEKKVGQLVNSQVEQNYSLDSHQHLIPERLIDASQVQTFAEEQTEHSNLPSSNFQTQNQMPSIGGPSANANIPPFMPPSSHGGSSSICISPSSSIRSETSGIAFSPFGGTFAFPTMIFSPPLQDISPIQVSSCGQPASNSKDTRIHRAFETEKYTRNVEITNCDEKLTHLSNNSFYNKLEFVNNKYGDYHPMTITHKNVYMDQPTFAWGNEQIFARGDEQTFAYGYEETIASCDGETRTIGEGQTFARDDEQTFACEECEKIFKTKNQLVQHGIVHINERPFACDQCHKTFKLIYHLTEHKKVHTNERPFACDECDMTFKQICQLTNHKKKHINEQPFACDECDMTFKQNYQLTNHKKKHTNERPFACDECGKTFKQKTELTIHGKVHYDDCPFACDICDMRYKYIENLIKHRKTHQDKNQD